jgi:hypothetical protein
VAGVSERAQLRRVVSPGHVIGCRGRRGHRAMRSNRPSSLGRKPPRLEQRRARGPIRVFGKVPHGAACPAPEEIDLSIVDHVREIDYRVTTALWAVRSCCHSPHPSQPQASASPRLRVDESPLHVFEEMELTRFLHRFGHWTASSVQPTVFGYRMKSDHSGRWSSTDRAARRAGRFRSALSCTGR